MDANPAAQPAEVLVQLVLRARHIDTLIQTDEDWRALGLIAARMLFWCGGAIFACRCEGSEMRFALQVLHAPLGTIAHQIAGAYATRLRHERGVTRAIFRHYAVIPLRDEGFLDDLVFWLHRSESPTEAPPAGPAPVWTADGAYLVPNSLPWINTDRVLSTLGDGARGLATYRRRKAEPISPQVIEYFTRRPQAARKTKPADGTDRAHNTQNARPNIETIARVAADYCKVSYEDMLTNTRKRAVSKARVIATVLATRSGFTAASAARLFNRSRSTLIEQAEHYRATQPAIFAEAEVQLKALRFETHD
jgi:hypothetical protein